MHMIITEIAWTKTPKVRNAAAALNLTMQQVMQFAKDEANGSAVWCTWVAGVLVANDSLGVLPKGSANLKVDIDAAIAADFVPTP